MPPIRCLLTVPHIQIKRTYHLEEGSVVALKHAIATCPVLGSQVQLSCSNFQVMDPLFNELVDLATEDSIPDMSKIVLMAQQESSGNEAPSCSSSQDDMPATPCVSYNGAVLEDAEFFWLMVDQTKCFQVTNAEEGLVAIMCANWLFNVQYACKAFNTLVVLERFFLELEKTTPRSVVAKFLNIVVKST
ncbi:uncharacterized protein LOC142814590 [Rhipicephalus microplus]|uniref:uncharacterized protein LOC142765342 n=1 Tax=Rhipicephalus microplus TaxID=6941 RepID=UPI003F6A73B3